MVDASDTTVLIRWIALLPLAGAVLQAAVLFVARSSVGKTWVMVLTLLPVALSFLLACGAFAALIARAPEARVELDSVWSWIGLGVSKEVFSADLAFRFDPLSGSMTLVVLAASLLILLYGLAFMEDDKRSDAGYQRFFTYANFLVSCVLVLILGDNLLVILAGWIGTGIGTSLLIGFWYSAPQGRRAAVRSLGLSLALDALLLGSFVALFWMLAADGPRSTSLADLQAGLAGQLGVIARLPFGFEAPLVSVLALGVALAACGRSAQFPFTFGLSGIARSPAPAAAMCVVSTSMGIYLCCRFSFLFVEAPEVMSAIAWGGAITAVIGAASALGQRDLVAILIAVTLAQFGFAFVAIGCGAFGAAIFQLVITILVQGLLILSAGSVIRALDGERDIRRMGGLNVRLVMTQMVVVAGVLSPAVFLAREQAISTAFSSQNLPGANVVYGLTLVATLLVSWAISRFLVGVFWGAIRTPLGFRGEFSDPDLRFMLPLYVLAVLTVLAVALNPAQIWGDLLIGNAQESDSLRKFLGVAVQQVEGAVLLSGTRWQLVAASTLATLVGFSTTYVYYVRFPPARMKINAKLSPVQQVLQGRDVGGFLERSVARPLVALARVLAGRSFSVADLIARLRGPQDFTRSLPFVWLRASARPDDRSQLHLLLVLAGALLLLALGVQ